jgi:hypothetical protein
LFRQVAGGSLYPMITFSPGAWRASTRFAIGIVLSLLTMGPIAASYLQYEREIHPLFGVVLKAGQVAQSHFEGHGVGYWTSNGVRRAALPTKSDGPPILLIGDSFTEGLQVSDAEHYGHILERQLQLAGKGVPVLTFAKTGCSVADYVAISSNLMAVFAPGWVIIQIQDVDLLYGAWGKKAPGRARFVQAGDKNDIKVVVQPLREPRKTPRFKRFARWLAAKFPDAVPYHFVYHRVNEFQEWFRTEKPWFRVNAPPAPRSDSVKHFRSEYPVDQELELLSEVFSTRLTLLYVAPFDPKNPSKESEGEVLLRKSAASTGIRFVSLRDKFPGLAQKGRAPYGFSNTQFNQGHWNSYGHEAAAQLLFNDLMTMSYGIH